MNIHAIAEKLAAALRTHAQCQCQTKAYWPWRREYRCGKCRTLDEYDEHVKIEQGKSK